ncbi:MAG: putative capsular polysaccharide synthesis family protein [Halioglobus sp.]
MTGLVRRIIDRIAQPRLPEPGPVRDALPAARPENIDVVIFQMGKVASTAIAAGLGRSGLHSLQAHVACPGRLAEKLHTIANPALGEEVATRVYQDFLLELRVMYLLARIRRNSGAGDGLNIITPVRDPVSWYWSHFAEMYDHYRGLLLRYWQAQGGTAEAFDPRQVFLELLERMFGLLEKTAAPLDSVAGLASLQQEANELDPSNVLASQVNRFLVPLRWFDEDFLPATGVDVYRHPFDTAGGSSRLQEGGFSVLLLQYEKLGSLVGQLESFTGASALDLGRENASEDKEIPFDLAQMQKSGLERMSPALVERIYDCRYSRHFGYFPAGGDAAP